MRAWEAEFLWELATPSYPAERREPEPDSPLRTPFQRDRDRIVHSKAFRRLKHKTQVFIAPEGDHYRTRLTHTLETCGIARTVARALGLNEDLTEAIGLAHDLGHPPFGHIGEEVLDEALRERTGRTLPPQRALAAGGGRARARRAWAQPDRAGARRDPQPHGAGASRRRSRGGSCGWSTGSRTSTTTSTTRCGPGSSREDDLPGGRDRAAGADRVASGSTRWSSDIVERLARGGRHRADATRSAGRCCGCGSSCSSACIWGRRRGASTSGCSGRCAGSSTTTWQHPDEIARGRRGGGRSPAGHRLHRGDDRPLLHRDVQAAGAAGGVAAVSRFTTETIERVRGAADIVEIVSAYTDLRRAGERYTGLCPFHEERTPSFSVDPQDKLYYCFGCEAGGDVFKFVAGEGGAGVPGGGRGAGRALRGGARARGGGPAGGGAAPAAGAARRAARADRDLLRGLPVGVDEAAKAREYLAARGLGEEVLREFGVGYRAERLGHGADARPAGGLLDRGAGRRGARCRRGRGASSTTAFARGSCSRSATRAGGCRASGRGRCGRTRSRST